MIKTEPELAGDLYNKARGVISKQLIASAGTAVFFYIYYSGWAALSALYGGFVCIAASVLLLRGVSRASQAASESPGKSMTILYVGAAQRFLLVLALLGAGLALMKMHALGLLLGFGLAQLSTMLTGIATRNRS